MPPDIARLIADYDAGTPVVSHPMNLVHALIDGRRVTFCTDMERDPIQRNNRRGAFYERSDLEAIAKTLPNDATIVDIGANVGNHSLYFALFCQAARVIPIEPNPRAYRLLLHNVLLNGLRDRFDLSRLGVGVSDTPATDFAMEDRERNLGAAKMIEHGGDIEVHRGDTLLSDVTPDFIKIDVEGMELSVLKGLSGLFDHCRPGLLVEVDNENEAAFLAWAETAGYATAHVFQRYKLNKNYLMQSA